MREANEPDPAVVAAIAAAVEATWPRPAAADIPNQHEPSRWRFSTRWWSRPAASRRPW